MYPPLWWRINAVTKGQAVVTTARTTDTMKGIPKRYRSRRIRAVVDVISRFLLELKISITSPGQIGGSTRAFKEKSFARGTPKVANLRKQEKDGPHMPTAKPSTVTGYIEAAPKKAQE